MTTDVHYKLMRLVEANPEISQRDMSRHLGISLGKVNYVLQALIKRGWIKVASVGEAERKSSYTYRLTPLGLRQKTSLALKFLQAKTREFELLREEISEMRREVGASALTSTHTRGVSSIARK